MANNEPVGRRTVQTVLEGRLLADFEEIERITGIKTADLLRQGAVRLSREFRASGKLLIEPLPTTASSADAA